MLKYLTEGIRDVQRGVHTQSPGELRPEAERLSQPAGLQGLLAERLLHDFDHQVDILWSTVVAHEPHPPHLPGAGSQPSTDLHLVADQNKRVTTLIH